MSVLGTAVTLVGIVTGLNLLLLYGVIRRLRTHSELLARTAGPVAGGPALRSHVEPFSVTTVDGRELSNEALESGVLVGFFAPDCTPCEELLPKFVAALQDRPGAPAVAVVAEGDGTERYVTELQAVATVIARTEATTIAAAFGVQGYPTLCQVDADGTIRDLPQHLLNLPQGVPA